MLARLQDCRTVTRRQLRHATRAARREAELADQPDVVTKARRYAETLARNPGLTKSRLARDLGISRVRLFQVLNLLKLPDAALEFIAAHDSPEHRAVFTERRLHPLVQMANEAEQLARFRELQDCIVLWCAAVRLLWLARDSRIPHRHAPTFSLRYATRPR